MNLKQRLTFTCWNCQREYSLFIEEEDAHILYVECPFCEKEAVVDLAPYLEDVVEVFKHGSPAKGLNVTTWNFPEPIPTTEAP